MREDKNIERYNNLGFTVRDSYSKTFVGIKTDNSEARFIPNKSMRLKNKKRNKK